MKRTKRPDARRRAKIEPPGERMLVEISAKGQVTIPSRLRARRGLEPRSVVEAVDTPEGVLLRPVFVVRRYTDEEIERWERESSMTPSEVSRVRRKLGLR